jgi:hypothetical protein
MAAPVSVIRMALLMLKRQVSTPEIDAAACEERVALIEDQVSELVKGVRSLRDWELATADDGITRSALVAQCVGLMRVAFDQHGVVLDVDRALVKEEAQPGDDSEALLPAAAALRYLLLGALGYLHDGSPGAGAIRLEADGESALRLEAMPRALSEAHGELGAHRAPRALAIDAIALQSLAEDLGYEILLKRDVVCLALAPGLARFAA